MSIGFGQLLVILLLALVLLGKFPNIKDDITNGLKAMKDLLSKHHSEDVLDSNKKQQMIEPKKKDES